MHSKPLPPSLVVRAMVRLAAKAALRLLRDWCGKLYRRDEAARNVDEKHEAVSAHAGAARSFTSCSDLVSLSQRLCEARPEARMTQHSSLPLLARAPRHYA